MKNLDTIAVDLFEKIRGRFSNVTLGDSNGKVTNVPKDARYFDFSYVNEGNSLGQVSVNLDEDNGIVIVVSKDMMQGQVESVEDDWFNFLKEIRLFAKKRLMTFDVRDINKSNLNKRDYNFLAKNRPKENPMAESKMYGTHKTSYQKIGNARLAIKHIAPINTESASGRTHKINAIYIESPTGERFKYPFKHLSGARAMARHVSEGGNAYDEFGKYISSLSEEMSKLRKFNQYMGRSSVMAETLAEYTDIVKDRIKEVRKTIGNLQKESFYKETFKNFVVPVIEDVPEDVAENWIDQLTIKQFNEELKDVFPYIYSLVSQATLSEELGPDDIIDESGLQYYTGVKKHGKEYMKKAAQAGREGASQEELGRLKDKYSKAEKKTKEEIELEHAFEATMGQFSDHVCEDCGNPSWHTLSEEKQKGVDGKVCWKGYKRMGTKMKGGKRVDNCVKVGEATVNENLRPGRDFDVASKEYNGYVLGGYDDSDDDRRATEWGVYKAIGDGTYKQVSSVKDPKSNGKYPVSSFSNNVPYEEFKWTVDNMLSKAPEGKVSEADLEEAYISTSKDAIETLGNLRKIGKSIELGQGSYDGNLAGMYVNDVYDVITWLESNADISDPKFKQIIASVIELRKKAKGMEREPGSGKDAQFGNEIVNTLYPLMQWIEMNATTSKEADEYSPSTDSSMSKNTQPPQTPIGEYILSYFDREQGKFPKGETAVLTAVQKEYGDMHVKPAAKFIKKVEAMVAQRKIKEIAGSRYPETEMIKKLAGI